mgnify:CR=1 FL=1
MTMALVSLDILDLFQILAASFTGAILCLDRIFVQAMFSRPIVAATITGMLMGGPFAGLMVGALIEMFWVNKYPLGTYTSPNDTVVAVLTTITVVILEKAMHSSAKEILVLSILLYIPVGILAQKLECLTARFNEQVSENAILKADSPGEAIRSITPVPSILMYFLYSLSLIGIFLAIGIFFIPWLFHTLPPFAHRALSYAYYPLPLIGVAVVLTTSRQKKTPLYFSGVFVIATLLNETLEWI